MAKQVNYREAFGEEEWAYILRLGSAIPNKEAKKAFWETIKEKKRQDRDYSIFQDFPPPSLEKDETKRLAEEALKIFEGKKAETSWEREKREGGWLTEANPGEWCHTYQAIEAYTRWLYTDKYNLDDAWELIRRRKSK